MGQKLKPHIFYLSKLNMINMLILWYFLYQPRYRHRSHNSHLSSIYVKYPKKFLLLMYSKLLCQKRENKIFFINLTHKWWIIEQEKKRISGSCRWCWPNTTGIMMIMMMMRDEVRRCCFMLENVLNHKCPFIHIIIQTVHKILIFSFVWSFPLNVLRLSSIKVCVVDEGEILQC